MDDIFDSAINLEEKHIDEGWQKGIEDGRTLGFAEGKDLGVVKGFEIAAEVGFYKGCVKAWRHIHRLQPGTIPTRADKAIASMEGVLDRFPLQDPKDEYIMDAMQDLRAKHKVVTAMLNPIAKGQQEQKTAASLDFLDF